MNKLKESELLRSLVGFLLLFLLFIGLFIFIVPSNHRSSKIADKIRFVKKEKVTYVAIGDSLTQGVGDSSKQGGFVPVLSQALELDFLVTMVSRETPAIKSSRGCRKRRISKGISKRQK